MTLRHLEDKPGLVWTGCSFQRATVRPRDLRGDIEAESQTLLTGAVSSRVRPEQIFHGFVRYRCAIVRDRKFEHPVDRTCGYANGLCVIAIIDGVAKKIGEKLPHPASITVDRFVDVNRSFYCNIRPNRH